jgi:hypothetical protein
MLLCSNKKAIMPYYICVYNRPAFRRAVGVYVYVSKIVTQTMIQAKPNM